VYKFGTASSYFNGSSYIQYPDSDDYDFGTKDFTIDFWVRYSGHNANYDTLLGFSKFWDPAGF